MLSTAGNAGFQASEAIPSSRFATPRAIAGKRASTARGITIRCNSRSSSTASAGEAAPVTHQEVATLLSLLFTNAAGRSLDRRTLVSLGRTPSVTVPTTAPQDAERGRKRASDGILSRCQLPRPNCQGTPRAGDASSTVGSRPCPRDCSPMDGDTPSGNAMDRGSFRGTGTGLNPWHGSLTTSPKPHFRPASVPRQARSRRIQSIGSAPREN